MGNKNSVVGVFVQSNTGLWYKDPEIRNNDWKVIWPGDDLRIELIVKAGSTHTGQVIEELQRRGWRVYLAGRAQFRTRFLNGKFVEACCVCLKQAEGPPDGIFTDGKRWKDAGIKLPDNVSDRDRYYNTPDHEHPPLSQHK